MGRHLRLGPAPSSTSSSLSECNASAPFWLTGIPLGRDRGNVAVVPDVKSGEVPLPGQRTRLVSQLFPFSTSKLGDRHSRPYGSAISQTSVTCECVARPWTWRTWPEKAFSRTELWKHSTTTRAAANRSVSNQPLYQSGWRRSVAGPLEAAAGFDGLRGQGRMRNINDGGHSRSQRPAAQYSDGSGGKRTSSLASRQPLTLARVRRTWALPLDWPRWNLKSPLARKRFTFGT